MIAHPTPFRSVVLDVNSTVSGIEGIDWLAQRRGVVVSRRVADLTQRAMQGGVPLEDVYGTRLAEIRPRREEVDALSRAYVEELAPGAQESIARLRRAGMQVVLVSGGLRCALFRLAFRLARRLYGVRRVVSTHDVARQVSDRLGARARRPDRRRRRRCDRPRDARR